MSQALELAHRLRAAIADERALAAIASIPRERFVPDRERGRAYDNVALPIARGQTISQPLVVARMLELVAPGPGEKILDIGTGSGYHAALLALLGGHVWTIERQAELSELARVAIESLGLDNVTLIVGDGWRGLPAQAPFDVINVAAAIDETNLPLELEDQLADGGRLVAPIGRGSQHLMLSQKTGNRVERTLLEAVRFVPLVHD
jgi:protein-L-isoaspartate(D-aspartate) O-methyltransferase